MFTGIAVFIESNLSVLTAGIFARGLFDRFGMSRARLAYIIDSTSAPVCILILLNGWGGIYTQPARCIRATSFVSLNFMGQCIF